MSKLYWADLTFPPINLWSYPMPDITMCMSYDCEKKEQCYRYKADPSRYNQAYWDFKSQQDGECKFFQPITQTVKEGEKFHVEAGATYEVRFIK